MLARFLVHYEAHLADSSQPFPGAKETLDGLKESGALLVVVTNKFEGFSVKLLEALGLADYFAVIAGSDTFPMRKPDAGHLLGAVSRAGGHSALTVMVGDSRTDVAHRPRRQCARGRGEFRIFGRSGGRAWCRPRRGQAS